jgi:hypothetical protein
MIPGNTIPPILDFLNNPRMTGKEIQANAEKIFKLIVEPAEDGDLVSPLRSIYAFLFDYATMMIWPENKLNMTKQNVVSFYNACHINLINRILSDVSPTGEPSREFIEKARLASLDRAKQTKLEDYGISLDSGIPN